MSYLSYTTLSKPGGYESLLVYWLALEIYDLTDLFCKRYINKHSRTYDQMIQAARSGKQNIVEGSLVKSLESNIKLTSVARASYGELLEDYKDYLRQNRLQLWSKDDLRVLKLRQIKNQSYRSNVSYESYKSYLLNPEGFANLLITLCFKEGYLLDKLLLAQENKFIKEGGFRENLFKKRLKQKLSNKSY